MLAYVQKYSIIVRNNFVRNAEIDCNTAEGITVCQESAGLNSWQNESHCTGYTISEIQEFTFGKKFKSKIVIKTNCIIYTAHETVIWCLHVYVCGVTSAGARISRRTKNNVWRRSSCSGCWQRIRYVQGRIRRRRCATCRLPVDRRSPEAPGRQAAVVHVSRCSNWLAEFW